ncbi:Gfo/Idh/MocA family oxidoreductase [Micromonospora sp. KC606]|uniref:Gfo/Idh/MocA family protein n=1 Tax=Micromonospora sp. KC606 TaxID=2530379 RepID=UPI001404D9D3|nr:Gfo/Idh/MocA family oxidoreductase [Micromonospora sp. KC606]
MSRAGWAGHSPAVEVSTARPWHTRPVTVGLVGAGVMGADHARLLSGSVSGARVGGVCDVDEARARQVAGATGARLLSDPFALIADDDIDAVLVASSDPTHEAYVLAAIALGKPVLCEKPLAPTVDGCQRIVDAETAFGSRLVTVGFMRRYDPGYLELKRALDDGEIGAPLVLHCVHRNPTNTPGQPSAAVITNSAVHELDVSRWLLGEEVVEATVHTPRRAAAAGGTADPQLLVLRTASGVLVDVEVFVNAGYGYEVRCELVGEAGTVELDRPSATVQRRGGVIARPLATDWRPRFAEAYRRELQDWVDGVRLAAPPAVSPAATAWDGFAATYLAQACVRALETGAPATVDLPARPKLYEP